METMTAYEASQRFRTARPAPRRRALGSIVVAAVYTLLLLGAPLIVRYGPEPEVSAAVARVPVTEVAIPRCAYAPEFGRSCDKTTPAPLAKGRFALYVP